MTIQWDNGQPEIGRFEENTSVSRQFKLLLDIFTRDKICEEMVYQLLQISASRTSILRGRLKVYMY
jgi:hypothetical protein